MVENDKVEKTLKDELKRRIVFENVISTTFDNPVIKTLSIQPSQKHLNQHKLLSIDFGF